MQVGGLHGWQGLSMFCVWSVERAGDVCTASGWSWGPEDQSRPLKGLRCFVEAAGNWGCELAGFRQRTECVRQKWIIATVAAPARLAWVQETACQQGKLALKPPCAYSLVSTQKLRLWLAGCGRYIDQRAFGGLTPLHFAVVTGNLESVQALLRAGASIMVKTGAGGGLLGWGGVWAALAGRVWGLS